MKEIKMSTDIFDSIYIMSRVADDIRIAVYFLPASHQTGHLAYIRESGMVIFITDFIFYF